MALNLNVPITKEMLRVVGQPWRPTMMDLIQEEGRWPLFVYYVAGKVSFTPRDNFRLLPRQLGPSDCQWIVPGSTP